MAGISDYGISTPEGIATVPLRTVDNMLAAGERGPAAAMAYTSSLFLDSIVERLNGYIADYGEADAAILLSADMIRASAMLSDLNTEIINS